MTFQWNIVRCIISWPQRDNYWHHFHRAHSWWITVTMIIQTPIIGVHYVNTNNWRPPSQAGCHLLLQVSCGHQVKTKMVNRRTKQKAKSKIWSVKCLKEHIPIFWFQIICSGMRGQIIGDHYIKQNIRFLCVRSFHFRSSKGSGAVFYSDPVERSYFFSGVKKIWSSASDKALSALW